MQEFKTRVVFKKQSTNKLTEATDTISIIYMIKDHLPFDDDRMKQLVIDFESNNANKLISNFFSIAVLKYYCLLAHSFKHGFAGPQITVRVHAFLKLI